VCEREREREITYSFPEMVDRVQPMLLLSHI